MQLHNYLCMQNCDKLFDSQGPVYYIISVCSVHDFEDPGVHAVTRVCMQTCEQVIDSQLQGPVYIT